MQPHAQLLQSNGGGGGGLTQTLFVQVWGLRQAAHAPPLQQPPLHGCAESQPDALHAKAAVHV